MKILLIVFSLIFSFWLMFHTFSYTDGTMYIATKAWSDFASHIPLIRSFSLGDNSGLEFPLFPGEAIRYHFLFYAIVGFLERMGLRIDVALNIPSAFSFSFLLFMIFVLGKTLFKKNIIGIISVALFLFNGSLSFVYFFKQHSFSDIVTNNVFPAFAPYDNTLISGGFWNLNIFTNQRHFALPLAVSLAVVFLLVKNEEKRKSLPIGLAIIFGLIIGLFSFLHGAVFIMISVIVGSLFVLFPHQRKSIAIMLICAFFISLPRILFLWGVDLGNAFKINPGYLTSNNLTFFNWIRYWILNLGLGFFLIPIGFILAGKTAKKVFVAFSTLFIIGNVFQFSPDIATNHKFFNLWIILANMFTAYVLYLLWRKTIWQKTLATILLFFLLLSGIIEFFPIVNDYRIAVSDYPKDQNVKWIMENTPKKAVFANSTYLYHPASLAGRKIFLGWPYFPWSLGYNTNERMQIQKAIFAADSKENFCEIVEKQAIDYVAVTIPTDEGIPVNDAFFADKKPSYKSSDKHFSIYEVKKLCL